MKINTKFKVGDLVVRKFDRSAKNDVNVAEVMEINTQTCYAETQIFYLCKAIMASKLFKHQFKEEGEFEWIVAHGVSKNDHGTGWRKYREDELLPASKEMIKVILGK